MAPSRSQGAFPTGPGLVPLCGTSAGRGAILAIPARLAHSEAGPASMPTVIIPPPYQGPTRGAGRVEVPGETLRECLDALEARYPGFRAQVLDAEGRVHRFVKLFLNRETVAAGDLAHPLAPRDELEIVAAIAGG